MQSNNRTRTGSVPLCLYNVALKQEVVDYAKENGIKSASMRYGVVIGTMKKHLIKAGVDITAIRKQRCESYSLKLKERDLRALYKRSLISDKQFKGLMILVKGATLSEVGAIYGCKRQAIHQWVRKAYNRIKEIK